LAKRATTLWGGSVLVTGVSLIASAALAQPSDRQLPCEAYSQSAAVFVGEAAAPVVRFVEFSDAPPVEMKLTPVIVERAYSGVATSVMYLTPLGIERYPAPGRRYLVYGRRYRLPDVVMASPGIGAKEIERATEDLAFLDGLSPGIAGGVVAGIVRHKEITYGAASRVGPPVGGILVRIFSDKHSTETVTGPDGRFVVRGIPAGVHQVVPSLPDRLIVADPPSRIYAVVSDGGCATVTVDTVPSSLVRGVLRGPDGQPLVRQSVDLVPMDIEPDAVGHIKGMGSVATNESGVFEFTNRPPGRYYLGVNLYLAPNPYGPSYPRTYYPGTSDLSAAMPIIVEHGRANDGLDFSVPRILPKGELEVIVENDRPGPLTLCFVELEDLVRGHSSHTVRASVPQRMPVVDGQRYEVHVHLQLPGGHLESSPYIFTATTGKTVVRLQPEAPRTLHP
jgi:hypothetical protein